MYFHEYKLVIEIDENAHSNRNINYEVKRQKAIEQDLGCKSTRIDLDKEDFDISRAVNEIFRHNKQSTKKTSMKLNFNEIIRIRF